MFLEYFKGVFGKLFYSVDLFKNFLTKITNNIRNMKILYFILIVLFLCVVDKGTGDFTTRNKSLLNFLNNTEEGLQNLKCELSYLNTNNDPNMNENIISND